MSLKKLFLKIVILITVSQVFVVLCVLFFMIGNYNKVKKEGLSYDLDQIVKLHRNDLSSNLSIGDSYTTKSFLDKISKSNNMKITLTSRDGNHFVSNNLYHMDDDETVKNKYVIEYAGILLGEVILEKNIPSIEYSYYEKLIVFILIQVLFIGFGVLTLYFWTKRKILTPFKEALLRSFDGQNYNSTSSIPSEFLDVLKTLCNASKLKKSIHKEKAISKLATQVAHDIRSPLAALDMATENLDALPEDMRIMIRSGISRIRDIANNLLNLRNSERLPDTEMINSKLEVELLSSLVESIISEKRTQHRDKLRTKICYRTDQSTYGLFSEIDQVEFKRLISNLINNAVEALPGSEGEVVLELSGGKDIIQVLIKDNGIGIPEEILSQLGKEGKTFGKSNGNGLGISHALQTIESWGGTFEISSKENIGTEILICIKRASPPKWFVEKISATGDIIILDDDETVHRIWKERIKQLDISNNIYHFSTAIEARNWLEDNKDESYVFLCDYELIGQGVNGLEFIKELNISKNSILVTSRYDEKDIMKESQSLGVKLIPKGLAPIVPMDIKTDKLKEAIYIDDEELLRMGWSMHAKRAGIILHSFSSPEDFKNAEVSFDKSIPFYIDSNFLPGEQRGEDFAKDLHLQGYDNLYLATGHDAGCFQDTAHLRGIIGKQPPWMLESSST